MISVTSNIVPGLFRSLMHDGADPAKAKAVAELVAWLFQVGIIAETPFVNDVFAAFVS